MPRTVSRSGSRSARHASKHKATKSRKKSRKSRKKNESSASDSDNSKSNHKRRVDERHRSVSSDDDDLKLNKKLHPIGHYMRDRVEMVRQMFATLRRSELKKMLPEKLKKIPLDDLAALCAEELEVMSKKRIRHVLDGVPMSESSDSDESDSAEESEQGQLLHSQMILNAQRKSPPRQVAADSTTAIVDSFIDSPSAISAAGNNDEEESGNRLAIRASPEDDIGEERIEDDDDDNDGTGPEELCDENSSIVSSHELSPCVEKIDERLETQSTSIVERETTPAPADEAASLEDAPTDSEKAVDADESTAAAGNSTKSADENIVDDSIARNEADATESDQMRIWSQWLEKKRATSPELRGIIDPKQWLATDRGSPANVALPADEGEEDALSSNGSRSGSERSTSDFWNSDDADNDEKASDRQLEPGILRSPTPGADEPTEASEGVEEVRVGSPPPPPAPRLGDKDFNPYRDAALSVLGDRIANEITDDGGWRVVVDGPVQGCGGRPEHWHNEDEDDMLEEVETEEREELEDGECDDERDSGALQRIPLPGEVDCREATIANDEVSTGLSSSDEDDSSNESDSPVEGDLGPGDDDFPGAGLFSASTSSMVKRSKLIAPESDDEGVEGYNSGPEVSLGTGDDELLPPGIAPVANIPHIKSRQIPEDETGQSVRKKTTIVSVRQLYKQIKQQRELSKQPDKVYTADEEARMRQLKEQVVAVRKQRRVLRIEKERQSAQKYEPSHLRKRKEKPAGPLTPPPGIEWDYPEEQDEQDKGVLVAEWPVIKQDSQSTATAAKQQPIQTEHKKKKSQLTPEFLERLEQKRQSHEEEIKKKMEVLAQLKAQRLELTRREKESKEKLKKMKAELIKKNKRPAERTSRISSDKEKTASVAAHHSSQLPPVKVARMRSESSEGRSIPQAASVRKESQRKRNSDAQEPISEPARTSKEDHSEPAKKARIARPPQSKAEGKKKSTSDTPTTSGVATTETASAPPSGGEVKKPNTDLEILELEMRARAIRALMKRSDNSGPNV